MSDESDVTEACEALKEPGGKSLDDFKTELGLRPLPGYCQPPPSPNCPVVLMGQIPCEHESREIMPDSRLAITTCTTKATTRYDNMWLCKAHALELQLGHLKAKLLLKQSGCKIFEVMIKQYHAEIKALKAKNEQLKAIFEDIEIHCETTKKAYLVPKRIVKQALKGIK